MSLLALHTAGHSSASATLHRLAAWEPYCVPVRLCQSTSMCHCVPTSITHPWQWPAHLATLPLPDSVNILGRRTASADCHPSTKPDSARSPRGCNLTTGDSLELAQVFAAVPRAKDSSCGSIRIGQSNVRNKEKSMW